MEEDKKRKSERGRESVCESENLMALNMGHTSSHNPPKSLDEMLREVTEVEGIYRKLYKLDQYCKMLESEKSKVEVFKRELPYCRHLLIDALDILKMQVMHFTKPKTKALMPLQGISREVCLGGVEKFNYDLSDKRTWMSSAQLWSSGINYEQEKQGSVADQNEFTDDNWSAADENRTKLRNNRNKGKDMQFVPFTGQFTFPTAAGEDKAVSRVISYHGTTIPVTKLELGSCSSKISFNRREKYLYPTPPPPPPSPAAEQLQLGQKKTRRTWSADLHSQFLVALEKLGGAEVATPKQIKALMEVDGLTTSELKSHLQKFRLHTRVSSNTPAPRRWRFDQYEDHVSLNPRPDHSGAPQGSFLP